MNRKTILALILGISALAGTVYAVTTWSWTRIISWNVPPQLPNTSPALVVEDSRHNPLADNATIQITSSSFTDNYYLVNNGSSLLTITLTDTMSGSVALFRWTLIDKYGLIKGIVASRPVGSSGVQLPDPLPNDEYVVMQLTLSGITGLGSYTFTFTASPYTLP